MSEPVSSWMPSANAVASSGVIEISRSARMPTSVVVNAPSAADNVNFYWTRLHTLDGSTSTIPSRFDELIAEGAAGYAALDWTSFATNRLNTAGDDVWGRYKAFADERLRQFRADLSRLGRNNTVRQRRLYTTEAPSIFEQSRVKY